jgi:S1-C subfamily serine protease
MIRNNRHLYSVLIVLALLFTSICVVITTFSSDKIKSSKIPFSDHFVHLKINKTIDLSCENEDTACHSLTSEPILAGTASGVAFQRYDNFTYVLTAEHFCNSLPEIEVIFKEYINTDLKIIDNEGVSWDGEIIHTDTYRDLCLIKTAMPIYRDISIARKMPETGDEIMTISFPLSIDSRGIDLYFTGQFAGCDSGDNCFFTLPATFGSSGSVVLNSRFEMIGMIQRVPVDFNAIAIGIGIDSLKRFLETAESKHKLTLISN